MWQTLSVQPAIPETPSAWQEQLGALLSVVTVAGPLVAPDIVGVQKDG